MLSFTDVELHGHGYGASEGFAIMCHRLRGTVMKGNLKLPKKVSKLNKVSIVDEMIMIPFIVCLPGQKERKNGRCGG
jgi:hypothetical protein